MARMSPLFLFFHHDLFKWDETSFFDVTDCSCSSSVCACLALVPIPWCWSTPAKWTPSRTSMCCWVSSRTMKSQLVPTSTAAPTGDSVAFRFSNATRSWWLWVSLQKGQLNCLVCLLVGSFLCRSVAVESGNRVAVFQLSHRTHVRLLSSTASYLLVRSPCEWRGPLRRHVMWPVPVALHSTKYMQSQKRSSQWSTWSPRRFVSPPMADLHRTGLLISLSLLCFH